VAFKLPNKGFFGGLTFLIRNLLKQSKINNVGRKFFISEEDKRKWRCRLDLATVRSRTNFRYTSCWHRLYKNNGYLGSTYCWSKEHGKKPSGRLSLAVISMCWNPLKLPN